MIVIDGFKHLKTQLFRIIYFRVALKTTLGAKTNLKIGPKLSQSKIIVFEKFINLNKACVASKRVQISLWGKFQLERDFTLFT